MLRKLAFWSAAIFVSFASAVAIADLAVIDGTGAAKTIKNFVCETTKLCNATVLIKSDGTEIGTASAPVRTDPTGTTTQPVSGSVTANAGTNLNTSALSTSAKQDAMIALLPTSLGAGGGLKVDGSGTPLPVSAADGGNVTFGAKADAKNAATDTTPITFMSVIKQVSASIQAAASSLASIDTKASSSIPPCSAAPCVTTIGNNGFDPSSAKGTPTFKSLSMSTITTTEIIPLSGSLVTYVTSLHVMAGGTANVTFKYGTGSNCGTGTTTLDGPYPLTAQAGMTIGAGTGAIMIVPAGKALCVTSDAAVQVTTGVTHQQI
jgi:hypothetical protein